MLSLTKKIFAFNAISFVSEEQKNRIVQGANLPI